MANRNILIISSLSPFKSANLGLDVQNSLKSAGYKVDFLTQYRILSQDSISVSEETEPSLSSNTIISRKKIRIKDFLRYCFHKKKKEQKKDNDFVIIHLDESRPPISTDVIVNKINKDYHFAIILFWQGMLTSHSLANIYNKMRVPLFIMAVDMFPFTGGCFYFWNCRNFIQSRCGECPGLNSIDSNDATRQNFIYKQQVYKNIKCVFLGNKWMRTFIEKTPIISDKPVRELPLVINENVFKIRDKKAIYNDFGIKLEDKQFIIFAGAPSISEKRKGFTYLTQSIELFIEKLPRKERSKIILLLAGNITQNIKSYFSIKTYELGFLDYEKLAKAYNVADVYISPSIEDAGPSMVNQSIMSGTPVVAFNIGVAQEIVITGKTGYCAKLMDAADLAKGITSIYSLSEEEYLTIQQNCRELGIKKFSYKAFAEKIQQYDQEFCET